MFTEQNKLEHWPPSTSSRINFRETFINTLYNIEYISVWPFQDPAIKKQHIVTQNKHDNLRFVNNGQMSFHKTFTNTT